MIDVMNRSGSYEGVAAHLNSSEYNSSEMSLSVLYMHELRRRNRLPNHRQTGVNPLLHLPKAMLTQRSI